MQREDVDFFVVEPWQWAIHMKLEDWGRWAIPRRASWIAPMFKFTRSNSRQWHPVEVRPAIDPVQCSKMESAVSVLPPLQRDAIRWFYVYRGNPRSQCQRLGVTPEKLYTLVSQGRQMLINRGFDGKKRGAE